MPCHPSPFETLVQGERVPITRGSLDGRGSLEFLVFLVHFLAAAFESDIGNLHVGSPPFLKIKALVRRVRRSRRERAVRQFRKCRKPKPLLKIVLQVCTLKVKRRLSLSRQ